MCSAPHHRPNAFSTGVLIAATALALTGCAGDLEPQADASAVGGHGFVAGAEELSEPQLRIVYADTAGHTRALDLLDASDREIAQLGGLDAASGDGRFFFAQHSTGDRTRLGIVDSGVWTVNHEDHFHYYLAEPGTSSTLTGAGTAQLASHGETVAIAFADEEEARLLDREALAAGEVIERRRIDVGKNATVVPFDGGILVASPEAGAMIAALDETGRPIDDAAAACDDAAGTATTRVGTVFGCADGALLVTESGGAPIFERIPYPAGTDAALRAVRFDNRAGRPALGAVAGDVGAWHLDTRAREWTLIPTEFPLLQVSAVGDDEKLLVAVDTAGRLVVLSASEGHQLAVSEPLVAASAVDPLSASSITLTVEASRAYVTGPIEAGLFEIDYRDGARVSRTFDLPIAPVVAELVG